MQRFKYWLVKTTIDMLMGQHQLSWEDVDEGIAQLKELRRHSSTAPIPFPRDFDPREIKGHTHVAKSQMKATT